MASGSNRRILNLPLIASGNVVSTIVLPLDDPSDNLTKKINLGQIKDFVLSGFTGSTISGDFLPLSGGTVNGNTIFNSGLTATTLTVNGVIITGDTFVTGGTYISGGTIVLHYNTGGDSQPITGLTEDLNSQIDGLAEADEQTIELDTINNVIRLKETVAAPISGNRVFEGNIIINGSLSATTYQNLPLGVYGTGLTFNTGNYDLTLDGGNGPLDTISLSILASDLTVTGGTYNSNTGVATFTNNTGGTFNVSGFLTGFTDINVTGATYNNNTFTFTNTSGGSFNVGFNSVTGLTSTGTLSSNTISATTYQNLPVSGLTAGTNIGLTNNNGNYTINVTGVTGGSFTGGTVSNATNFTGGLSANTFSSTTYQNLPAVIQVSCSDEVTALITGTTTTFRMPYDMLLTEVRGSLTTAQTSGSTFTVDILRTGTTMLSTLLTINNNQKTSKASGTTQSVITTPNLTDDDEISVRITQIGNGTARGLKVTMIGNRRN